VRARPPQHDSLALERVTARVLADPAAARLLGRALDSPHLAELVERVLDSEGAERLVAHVLDSHLLDASVARVLESNELWLVVEEIAQTPPSRPPSRNRAPALTISWRMRSAGGRGARTSGWSAPRAGCCTDLLRPATPRRRAPNRGRRELRRPSTEDDRSAAGAVRRRDRRPRRAGVALAAAVRWPGHARDRVRARCRADQRGRDPHRGGRDAQVVDRDDPRAAAHGRDRGGRRALPARWWATS
jgi:hypothetical protein